MRAIHAASMATPRANWVSTLSDCLAQIEREQVGSACPVVDHEVGQGTNGSAEDLTAWLICRNRAEQQAFTDTEMPRVVSALSLLPFVGSNESRASNPDPIRLIRYPLRTVAPWRGSSLLS